MMPYDSEHIRMQLEFERHMREEAQAQKQKTKAERRIRTGFHMGERQLGPAILVGLMMGRTEVDYPGYKRAVVPRDEKHWGLHAINFTIFNCKAVRFPACRKADCEYSWWVDGFALFSGAGRLLFTGKLVSRLEIRWSEALGGIKPEFKPGHLTLIPKQISFAD